ncbi:pol-like protein, partial [Paraphaeosphaeria sporulosa]
LRADLSAARTDVHQLQIQTQSATRARLPDPPRFDGRPLSLRTWLPSIRAKLRSDQLTRADAFDYQSEDTQSWDLEDIFSFFQRLYHNPREQQEAIQRFSLVRQREDESLIAYLARFERLAFEAKATTWPNVSWVTTLHQGLRPTLRQFLEESNDSIFGLQYPEYVELIQSYDRRARRPQNQHPNQHLNQYPKPARPEPMDVDPARVRLARPSSALSTSSSTSRHAHRLENDLYLYYGADDHWISDYPISRRTPSTPEPARTKSTARSTILSTHLRKGGDI